MRYILVHCAKPDFDLEQIDYVLAGRIRNDVSYPKPARAYGDDTYNFVVYDDESGLEPLFVRMLMESVLWRCQCRFDGCSSKLFIQVIHYEYKSAL